MYNDFMTLSCQIYVSEMRLTPEVSFKYLIRKHGLESQFSFPRDCVCPIPTFWKPLVESSIIAYLLKPRRFYQLQKPNQWVSTEKCTACQQYKVYKKMHSTGSSSGPFLGLDLTSCGVILLMYSKFSILQIKKIKTGTQESKNICPYSHRQLISSLQCPSRQ